MRMARVIVDPAHLKEYTSALQEEIESAVRKEPGVLKLWAVAEKEDPTRITIFEMYTAEEAFKEHIQTEHFKKYRSTVQNMVKSSELLEVHPIALESKEKT